MASFNMHVVMRPENMRITARLPSSPLVSLQAARSLHVDDSHSTHTHTASNIYRLKFRNSSSLSNELGVEEACLLDLPAPSSVVFVSAESLSRHSLILVILSDSGDA